MRTVWEVPVATTEEQLLGMSRRLLREATPIGMPRDARPSRARRERLPADLRAPIPRVE
jgi:hypothetical protein